jgi:hypothetical protein
VELLARKLHRRCPLVELDDLISAGTIGLIGAGVPKKPPGGILRKYRARSEAT